MAQDNFTLVIPQNSSIVPSDVTEPNRLSNASAAGVCPLCESNLRSFFINFNEKLLMCENTHCEYPFGHEEFQIYHDDNDAFFDDDLGSLRSNLTRRSFSEVSTVSTSGWSDIERLNTLIDTQQTSRNVENEEFLKIKQSKEQLSKVLKDMNELHEELVMNTIDNKREFVKIKNEKWIKNLKTLQDFTGVQMLKPSEMIGLQKEEPKIGLGELKIDIAQDGNKMSCIKIEIANNNK